tara:strand:- start:453 stop:815 length:363 start_codon:yes stop_codon:yes gene_type:complete
MKNFETVEELNIEVSRINLTQRVKLNNSEFEIFAKVNCINLNRFDDWGLNKVNPNDIELFIRKRIDTGQDVNVEGKEEWKILGNVEGREIWRLAMNWVIMQLNSIDIQHNDSSKDVKITH